MLVGGRRMQRHEHQRRPRPPAARQPVPVASVVGESRRGLGVRQMWQMQIQRQRHHTPPRRKAMPLIRFSPAAAAAAAATDRYRCAPRGRPSMPPRHPHRAGVGVVAGIAAGPPCGMPRSEAVPAQPAPIGVVSIDRHPFSPGRRSLPRPPGGLGCTHAAPCCSAATTSCRCPLLRRRTISRSRSFLVSPPQMPESSRPLLSP